MTRCIRAAALVLKGFVEILGPLALIFLAYQSVIVSRQQAKILDAQTNIIKFQSPPLIKVEYTDSGAMRNHADAVLRIRNLGGPVFEVETAPQQCFIIFVRDEHGETFYKIFKDATDLGYAEVREFGSPVASTNVYERNSELGEYQFRKYVRGIHTIIPDSGLTINGYTLNIEPIFILHVKWKDHTGSSFSQIYVVGPGDVFLVSRNPKWEVLLLAPEKLPDILDGILKSRRSFVGLFDAVAGERRAQD